MKLSMDGNRLKVDKFFKLQLPESREALTRNHSPLSSSFLMSRTRMVPA